MENIIHDSQIDPITANLVRHIKGCRPSINQSMGWSKWRKSLTYFTIPKNLTNSGRLGLRRFHMENTYAELIDVLPETQSYPRVMAFHLSPFGNGDLITSQQPYWKYIKLYYKVKWYDWGEGNMSPARRHEDIPFAIWGRDGRVRLSSSGMKRTRRLISMYNRLNALMGLSFERMRRDQEHGAKSICFVQHDRKLQYAIPQTGTRYWDSVGYLPVVDGDIYDVKTGEFHSRLLAGEPEMGDIMSDICPTTTIPSDLRSQFRDAPSNPSIRSAIRAQINEVLPTAVQDEQSLDAFFRQRRTIISESGVFAL